MKKPNRTGEQKGPDSSSEPLVIKRVSVYLLESERQAVRRAAFEQEKPFTEVIREAIRRHLNLGPGPEIRRGPRKDG